MTKLSRQRVWQLKRIAEGKCKICGKPRVDSQHCDFHRLAMNLRQKKRVDSSD